MKKTLFHGELVKMGPVRVIVRSEVLESKYQGKLNYVELEIDGHSRYYNCENADCEAFWDGLKGRTLTIEAIGSRDNAAINYIGDEEPEQEPAPAPRPAARPAPRRAAAPAQPAQAPGRRAAPAPAQHAPKSVAPTAHPTLPTREQAAAALFLAKCHVAKALTLQKLTLHATLTLATEFEAMAGMPMPPELFQSINASLFISAERAMVKASVAHTYYEDVMPMKVDLATLQVQGKQAAQAAAPAAAAPAPEPAPAGPTTPANPEPAEPEEDDVPF